MAYHSKILLGPYWTVQWTWEQLFCVWTLYTYHSCFTDTYCPTHNPCAVFISFIGSSSPCCPPHHLPHYPYTSMGATLMLSAFWEVCTMGFKVLFGIANGVPLKVLARPLPDCAMNLGAALSCMYIIHIVASASLTPITQSTARMSCLSTW